MAFKQYKDAPVKTVLTGAEKIHITDIDGTLKQVSIDSIGPETESIVSDNSNKVPTSAAIKAFVESKMDDVKMPIEVESAIETGGIGYTESETITIEWDGDTSGKTAVSGVFYHVSDNIFNWDALVGGTFVDASGTAQHFTAETIEELKPLFPDDNNDVVFVDYFVCALADGAEITVEGNTLTFPKKGVYFSTAYGTGAMSLTYGNETVHKIDQKYIPSGVTDPILENAIETHGMGWTETESREGYDIQWDGNTEGLEKAGDFYKVSNRILSKNEFLGGTLFVGDETVVITDDSEIFHELIPNKLYAFGGSGGVLISAGVEYDGKTLSSGVYFSKDHELYISRLYKKEATTEEVVHQIDQKYIPQSSGGSPVEFVDITWDGDNNPTVSKTVSELVALGESGKILYARLYIVEGDIKNLFTTVIATMFYNGGIEFGGNRYSPNRDGNYPIIVGYVDEDEGQDQWDIDF